MQRAAAFALEASLRLQTPIVSQVGPPSVSGLPPGNANCMAAGSSETSANHFEGFETDQPQQNHLPGCPAEPKEMVPKLHSQGTSIEDGGWPVGLRLSSPACGLEFVCVHWWCPETEPIRVTDQPQ